MTYAADTSPRAIRGSRIGWDAVALMVATAGTAGLGLLFWVVAARLYPAATVGTAAAQVAALNLFAGIAQLNLMTVLLRFLPIAGDRTPALLRWSYGAIMTVSVLAGGWLHLSRQFPGLSGPWALQVAGLGLAVAAFAFFLLQDGVLTAFGKARWVPAVKGVVAVAKLLLLVVLSGGGTDDSILLSWVAPTTAVVLVVTVAVFARLGTGARNSAPSTLPPARRLGSFVAAEYASNVADTVRIFLPPILVTHVLGSEDNAYFTIPWLVVLTTQTLLWNIVSPLIAESGRTPGHFASHLRRTIRVGAAVVSAGPVLLLVGAPYFLGLQGPRYADSGTGLMRLLALSLPFTGVVVLYLAVKAIEWDVWRLAGINAVTTAVFSVGTWLLLPHLGIVAVGWVYLTTQAGTALWLGITLARGARGPTRGSGSPTDVLHTTLASLRPDSGRSGNA
jgi:O-antigen/teichoic acid export membrane protein